jgi:hypothetical protein
VDDSTVLALLHDMSRTAPARGPVLLASVLNEAGEPYREIELVGEYEALQFAARMNAKGFVQLRDAGVAGYASVFCKPSAT